MNFGATVKKNLRSLYMWKPEDYTSDVTAYKVWISRALTHWVRDHIDAISLTTFSNAFSRMKMNECRLRFHWSLFLKFELTIFQHWFRSWLGADQATSHYLNQWLLVYWRIYTSLGLNELKRFPSVQTVNFQNFSAIYKGFHNYQNVSQLVNVSLTQIKSNQIQFIAVST